MGDLLALLGVLIFFGVLLTIVVLPIVMLVQFSQLKRRLDALEREVWYGQKKTHPPPAIQQAVEPIPVVERMEPIAAPPEETAEPPRKKPPRRVEPATDWAQLEAWLGMRGLGWAAVVLLLFTAGFFFKVLFERGLIGELGRVSIGVAVGVLLSVAGWHCHRRGQRVFSQMLTSGGVVLLYLSVFATFGFYHLMTKDHAAPFLIVLVAEAFALAALYHAPAIAIMAVIGGLLNPFLLDTGQDRYRELFVYLAILNAGVVTLALFRRWWAVTTLALLGTHLSFWLWYTEQYHPAKLIACIVFQLGILSLYLAQVVLVHVWQKQPANIEDLLRLILLVLLTATVGYQLLDEDYHRWLGTYAVLFATLLALIAVVVNRYRADDPILLFVLIGLVMFLIASVFPLQTEAAWMAVGWAAQGLVLWWLGLRVRDYLLYGLGALFLLLAAGRLLFIDSIHPHDEPFIPLLNRYGSAATLVSVSLIAAALLQRRTQPKPDSHDFIIMRLFGLIGVVLLWFTLTRETYDFFIVRGNLDSPGVRAMLTQEEKEMPREQLQQLFYDRQEHLRLTAQMSLSALWAIFALVQLAVGLRLQHRPLRWLSLGLFALTLGKVMFVDTERLHGMYRVGAFFALSLMMAAGAWAYQKLRHALAIEKEKDDESVT